MGNIPQYRKDRIKELEKVTTTYDIEVLEEFQAPIEKEKSLRRKAEAQVETLESNVQSRSYIIRASKQMIHTQAKRLREELILRSKINGIVHKLQEENAKLRESIGQRADESTRVRNLQNANTALNKALNERADAFRKSNDDYDRELVQMIKKGYARGKQLAEMIKEGEIRVEAFNSWEKAIETPSEEDKTEKLKLAKEKRRLLVSISGYSADVLKTLFNQATPIFIVAIVTIALVRIYG